MSSANSQDTTRSSNLTAAEWDIIEFKTFKCQLGIGDFEKRNVAISIEPSGLKDHVIFVINPDSSSKEFRFSMHPAAERCYFDPVCWVSVLNVEKLTFMSELIKYCKNDPDAISAESRLKNKHVLRVLFDPKGINVELLPLFMRALAWNGKPATHWMSHKAFPNDVQKPFNFDRPLMTSEDQTSLRNFYQQEMFTDFVLVSSDNRELKVHRVKIAGVCEVFLNMLSHDTIEKQEGICRITDVDFGTLKLMVDAFYGLPVDEKLMKVNCRKLYIAANKYQLLELQLNCSLYLEARMEMADVLEVFKIAKEFGSEKLMDVTVEFVRKNYEAFLESDGVLEVGEKIPEYSKEFFKLVSVDLGGKKRTASQAGL